MIRSPRLRKVILLCLCLATVGCQGGGTQGTGVPKKLYTGRVTTSDGAGFSDAKLEISESGDSTQSDENGNFELQSHPQTSSVTFVVSKDNFQATAVLDNPPLDNQTISIEISVDVQNNRAEARLITLQDVSKFDIQAEIVGSCRKSFTNQDGKIYQQRSIQNGTTCFAHVDVRGDGSLRGGVKVAVQRKPCRDRAVWITSEVGITSTRTRTGQVTIPFRFFDTDRACAYRIVAPFGQRSKSVEVLPIKTFAELRSEDEGL